MASRESKESEELSGCGTSVAFLLMIVFVVSIIGGIVSGGFSGIFDSDDDQPDHGCRKTFSFSGEENDRYSECVQAWNDSIADRR